MAYNQAYQDPLQPQYQTFRQPRTQYKEGQLTPIDAQIGNRLAPSPPGGRVVIPEGGQETGPRADAGQVPNPNLIAPSIPERGTFTTRPYGTSISTRPYETPPTNPEEDQAAAIDKEIKKFTDAMGSIGNINNRENLIAIGRQFGFRTSDIDDIDRWVTDPLGHRESDVRDFWTGGDVAAMRDKAAQQIQQNLAALNSQKQNLLSSARERRIGRLRSREEQLRSELKGTQGEMESAINAQLGRTLEEFGVQAGQARQQVGGSWASRGLERSTMAQRGVADVTAAEQQSKAQARLGVEKQQGRLQQLTGDTLKGITQGRERAQQQQSLAELQASEDISFGFDVDKINKETKSIVDQMDMDQAAKDEFAQILGGIMGAAGLGLGASIGGPQGAAAGGGAGYSAGSTIANLVS